MQPTVQQQAILQTNNNLVINAVAGSGKTTTLLQYAQSRPANSRILYLAFNKTVKEEAQQKFTAANLTNVKAETAHSLAFGQVVKYSPYKVSPKGYKSHEWMDLLHINTGTRHTDYIIASHINKYISFFCNSKATKVQELDYLTTIADPKARIFADNFYSLIQRYTREALAKMEKGEIDITHDFYLKKFQLSKPQLPYDYILFDEGQDASAAMLDVFLQQPAIKILVGDMHQQIYGWRYAVNSLQQVDFERKHLTQSFRFDEEIALIANRILAWKKHLQYPAAEKIIGSGQPGSILSQATLGRTNLQLLLNAIVQVQDQGLQSLHFEGDINSYTFAEEGASLYDILNLHNNKKAQIKDKLIAEMKNMQELEDYIEKTEDHSLSLIVEIVKEYGNQLPALINQLKSKHIKKEAAEMVFSTVHRCKGMEYDSVTLLNDFITEDKLQKSIAIEAAAQTGTSSYGRLAEEVNLLYVAATRAKSQLILPPEINPLRSLVIAATPPPPPVQSIGNLHSDRSFSDWETYSRQDKTPIAPRYKPSNNGKRWTDDETTRLTDLYLGNKPLTTIAKELGRGQNAVRIKLQQIGLLEEGDIF